MLKRSFDVICSSIGLIILFPIFILIAVWIKLGSEGPVFFRQKRVGLNGRIFKIHKFRTMSIGSENAGRLTIGSDIRVTDEGKTLRRLKLDELPQLIDVFLGKMSLVGPRPEVKEFIDLYPQEIRSKVLSVRPGITDLASIEMVDENDILSAFENPKEAYINEILPIKQSYYIDYVDNHSLIKDIYIILLTIKKIIFR